MIIIGIMLIMIGITINKKVDVINSKVDGRYIKYKIFVNILVGSISIITGIVQFFDSNLGNTFIGIFLGVVIVAIILEFILKRVFR